MDLKKGQPGHLTGKFEEGLRELLIHGETKTGEDMCQVLCSLGNTSLNEANHARAIRRGYHVKGKNSLRRNYYVIITSSIYRNTHKYRVKSF